MLAPPPMGPSCCHNIPYEMEGFLWGLGRKMVDMRREMNKSKVQQELCGIRSKRFTNLNRFGMNLDIRSSYGYGFEAQCKVMQFKCIRYNPIRNLALFEAGRLF